MKRNMLSNSWKTISASSCATISRREHAVGSDYPHAEATFRGHSNSVAHVRRRARGRAAQNHLRERREDVRLRAQLTPAAIVAPAPSCWREEARVIGHPEGEHSSGSFVAVGKTGELAAGEMKFVAVDRQRVVLANIDGAFYALRDVCGHRNAPLSRGKLIGCLIECRCILPIRHADRELVDGPISGDIPVYECESRAIPSTSRLDHLRAVAFDRFGVVESTPYRCRAPSFFERIDDVQRHPADALDLDSTVSPSCAPVPHGWCAGDQIAGVERHDRRGELDQFRHPVLHVVGV